MGKNITMKILFDARAFQGPVSGMARATVNLYIAASQIMPSLRLIAVHEKPLSVKLPDKIVTSCPKIFRLIQKQIIWQTNILNHRPDFLHFPNNAFLPRRLWPGPKIITTIHDVLPLNIPDFFTNEQEELYYHRRSQAGIDKSDLIITVSEYSKKEIVKNFSVRKEPLVIPLGPMFSTLQLNNSGDTFVMPDLDEKYFIYVGGYDKRKGMDGLLKVFLQLAKNGSVASKLYLTGKVKYYSPQIGKIINEGKELGFMRELGYVPDDALLELYRRSKALIYPSKYEGFGLPPLEAMAVGCPVITTPFMSLPEVCGDAVYYINPDNEPEFGKAIEELDNNQLLREELKQKGFLQAQKFSWEKSAERFLMELNKILNY
jgi:glycosyltransferase involved in cell wall biosynthesis